MGAERGADRVDRQMIGNDTIYYIVYALACAVFVVALITIVRTLSRDKAGRFVGSADRGGSDPEGRKFPRLTII